MRSHTVALNGVTMLRPEKLPLWLRCLSLASLGRRRGNSHHHSAAHWQVGRKAPANLAADVVSTLPAGGRQSMTSSDWPALVPGESKPLALVVRYT
jgi:hypothetical protein